MIPINNIVEVATIKLPIKPVQLASVPTVSGFFQNNSFQVGLGWATIAVAVVMIGCIILGVIKVAPVATSFWKRRNGMDEGAENAKNFAVGWAILIVAPIMIMAIAGMVFGNEVANAVTTALKSVFQ